MILDEINQKHTKDIEKLREDKYYYGEFGRNNSYATWKIFSY